MREASFAGRAGTIVDGTAGNTGIGLAMVGNALGMKTVIVIPETQTQEKKDTLRLLGAETGRGSRRCLQESQQLCEGRWPRRRAAGDASTRPARSSPTSSTMSPTAMPTSAPPARKSGNRPSGRIDGFVCAVGTGGTLAGVAAALRTRNPDIVIAMADVPGAALYTYYASGELKAEGSSITEGHRPGPHHRQPRGP